LSSFEASFCLSVLTAARRLKPPRACHQVFKKSMDTRPAPGRPR